MAPVKGDDMHALLWETEWAEILFQFCHMMEKSIQAPVIREDSGEGDRGAGVSTCCLTDFSSSPSSSENKDCALCCCLHSRAFGPALTSAHFSVMGGDTLVFVPKKGCRCHPVTAVCPLILLPSNTKISPEGTQCMPVQEGRFFCFNVRGITMASRVIFYST